MSYTTQKTSNIIVLTKKQYDNIKNGGSVDGYIYNSSHIYVPDIDGLYRDIKTATVSNSYNLDGHPADYYATKTDLDSYLSRSGGTITGNLGILERNNILFCSRPSNFSSSTGGIGYDASGNGCIAL